MIRQPMSIICVLLLIEAMVLFLAGHARTKKYFDFLPSVFWIYFLPMIASTVGLIDPQSPVYGLLTTHLLPASLFLLLIPVDIKAILRLGGPALFMMAAGSVGIILGTVISFALFRGVIGTEFWAGFGALSASWTGGSANMIAVKEAVGTPDRVFLPMVIVDTVVPYFWMGTLVALVKLTPVFDRFFRADRRILDELKAKMGDPVEEKRHPLRVLKVIALIAIAILGSIFAQFVAARCPEVKNIFSTYAWTIIVVTVAGLGLSLTPVRRLENIGASRVGYFLLYFVLTSIGAKANLSSLGSTVILIAAGLVIVMVHVIVLVAAGRLIKAPMFLAAVASQANIGGVASAPIVAEIYQPGFASVGLLLAILGNIVGTYLGILTAQLCRFVAGA